MNIGKAQINPAITKQSDLTREILANINPCGSKHADKPRL